MKRMYVVPHVIVDLAEIEKSFLASLGSSRGENLDGSKNSYDWDWEDE